MTESKNECRQAILATLSQVPFGKVSSYGQIARTAGQTGKARYVAYILKHLPSDSEIPWHRIINSQGKISFPEGSEQYYQQLQRLQAEGITLPIKKQSRAQFLWPEA